MSAFLVPRRHGINPTQLFQWRKLEKAVVLTVVGAGEQVVQAGVLDAARRRVAGPERLLGRKAMENEIRERKWIARSPLLPGCQWSPQ